MIAKGRRYILKNDRRELIDRITPLATSDAIKNISEFLESAVFTITKKSKIAKRKGTNVISESARFTAKMLERKTQKVNIIIGRSKIVLRNFTEPSVIILTARIKRDIRTTAPRKICLGKTKKSVLIVVTTRGKARNRSPNKISDTLFR